MNQTIIKQLTTIILCLLLITKPSKSSLQTIKIAAIFHEGEDELERAFDQAISDIAEEQTTFFRLIGVKRTNVEVDGFKFMKLICKLLTEEPIAAIFGPRPIQTRTVASSIAGKFGIPHFEYTFHPKDDIIVSTNTINVYPGNSGYEKAIADAAAVMNWHSYTIVFQSHDSLARIQEALENMYRPQYPINIRELMQLKKIKQLKTQHEVDVVYESLVKNINQINVNSLMLDVEDENLPKLLDTMNYMDLMGDYFMCLIVNLDSSSIDVRNFVPKDSVANITYFKFLKDENSGMSVAAALLYDAVWAFADALNNLYRDNGYSGEEINFESQTRSCWGKEKYDIGPKITATFLKKTKYGKKTGLMTFNEDGEREFEFDLINVQAGKTTKVGEWTGEELRINRNEKEMNASFNEALQNKVFKVTTRVGSPYITLLEDEDIKGGRLIGDKKYEGYCIDLIAKIEEFLGIKCEFELVPDGNYGSKNPITGQWNGLLGRLLELKADMAICDLTITSERQSAVDFTAPFMNLGLSILYSKAEKVVPSLFSFMSPLSGEVWMYMASAYLLVSLSMFLQARIAPDEWINPHPCNDEPEELENNFSLINCFWFSMASLMQQGSDILPRASSVRLLAGVWYFFILIMVSSYTANLAAFLTAVKMDETIDSVDDLAKQTKISYGAMKGGSTYSFFKNSNTTLYQRLFNTMSDAKPSVFTKTNDEGVERVIKGKRKYAFFMESTTIEYQIERHCELQQVGGLLDNKGYGIAMPPNSPYRTMISTAILHLQEKGDLNSLKQKWWKEKGGGMCDEETDEPENSNELGMSNVGGVFLILILGSLISIVIAMGEFFWLVNDTAIEEKISRGEAFKKELKFVFDFRQTVKRIKKNSSKATSIDDEDVGKQRKGSSGRSLRKSRSHESINNIEKGSIRTARETIQMTRFREENESGNS